MSESQNNKPKFKLSTKSSAKGGKKPSLKLGKKTPGKLSLKPKAQSSGLAGTPPAGITQPPMPSSPVPAPNLGSADLPSTDSQSLGAEISPSPVPIAELPPVPEPASDLPPTSEVPTGFKELPSVGESLPPPPSILGGEDLPDAGEELPAFEVPPLPPLAEPVSDIPPAPEAPTGLEGLPAVGESLSLPPPILEGVDLPNVSEELPVVEVPPLPSAPEPVSDLPPSPEVPTGFEGLPAVGESLPLPPPILGGEDSTEVGEDLPPVDEPSLPPVPAPVSDLPPTPEVPAGFDGLPPVSESLPPPPLPPMAAPDALDEPTQGLPSLSDVLPSSPPLGDADNAQITSENSLDNSSATDSTIESAPPSASATEIDHLPNQEKGNDYSNKIDELNEVVSTLSKEVARLKSESREELDNLFSRVDELGDVPAALKSEDEKVEDLSKSLESLKSNLGQEMESFKKLIQSQIEKKNLAVSSPMSTSGSLLSKSGQVTWSKEQYVVVSQDEKAGESSPLDVFITNTESEALEKVHYNMTNDRPIYFLYPNTLASDYNQKY